MIKAILFDFDGVVNFESEMFSDRLHNEKGIDLGLIVPFFKEHFGDCIIGKKDLKKLLESYYENWGFESVDDVLTYWFSGEHHPNMPLLGKIKNLRDKGILCYIATNNEKYRVQFIRDNLSEYFDEVFSSPEFGIKKPAREFYEVIKVKLEEKNITVGEIAYLDDEEENVRSAKATGFIHSYQCKNEECLEVLDSLNFE